MIRRSIVSLSLILLALTTQAQVKTVATYLGSASKRADRLYENQYYKEAIRLYLQALTNDPKNPQIRLQIAESFRHLNDPEQAAWWYGKVIYEKDIIALEHKLYYAQALLGSGQVQPAEAWYARYQQEYATDERVAQKLRGIDQMPTFYRDSLMYRVRPMDINSPASDFAPAFYQDGLVFISARETHQAVKQIFRWNETPYLSMFYAPINEEGTSQSPSLFNQKLASNYHEGPAVFYDNDTRIIFTRNHREGKQESRHVSNLGLFTAHRDGQHWKSPAPLSLNNPEYSVGHPTLTPDGKTLYFISDRPDGYGGTDLYVTHFRDGQWQDPVNLGRSVNTEGDEMFPFLHQDQTLYFASNGHGGLGGLDVYKMVLGSNTVENLGYPVNSRYDDFSFILNEAGTRGYFASNRNGDTDNDELYQVTVNFQYLDIVVRDKNTQRPIPEAEITLIGDGAIESTAASSDDGIARFRVNPHHTYIVNVDKPNYEGNALIVGPEHLLTAEESKVIPLTLTREEGNIPLTVAITNNYTGEPLPYTMVTVTHTEKNDTTYRLTDEEGVIRMKVGNDSHYAFSGEQDGRGWSYPEIATETLNASAENTLSVAIGVQAPTTFLQVMAYDADTKDPIERVTVRLIEDGEQRAELFTQANGEASFRVSTDRSYLVSLEALTHYDDVMIVMAEELTANAPYRVELPLSNAEGSISLVANLYDSVSGAPLANTVVRLRKEGTYEEVSSTSDELGNVRFKVEEKGSYRVSGGTDGERWSFDQPIKVDGEKVASPHWRIPVKVMANEPEPADKTAKEETPVSSAISIKEATAPGVSSLTQETTAEVLPKTPQSTASAKTSSPTASSVPRTQPLRLRVMDEVTGQFVSGAEITLIGDGAIATVISSDAEGLVTLRVDPTQDYMVDVSKNEYQGNAIILESKSLLSDVSNGVVIPLRPETGTIDLTARLYNKLTDQPIAYTLVHLVNTVTRDTVNQVTNEHGEIRVKVEEASYRLFGKVNGTPWSHPVIKASSLNATGENQLRIPLEIPATMAPLRIITLDNDTGGPVEGATVRLIEDGTQRALLRTGSNGEALFDVDPRNSYLVSIEPLAHYDDVAIVMSEELTPGFEYRIALRLIPAPGTISVEAQLYDSLTKSPLANTVVRIQHAQTGEEVATLSDEQGTIRMKVEPGASYRVSGRTEEQQWQYDTQISISGDNEQITSDLKIPVYQPLSYQGLLAEAKQGQRRANTEVPKENIPFSQNNLKEATFIVINGRSHRSKDQQLWAEVGNRIYQLSTEDGTWYLQHQGERVALKGSYANKGWWRATGDKTITIQNIHFGFDQYAINATSAKELDKIVALMKRQPTLRIKASTHADSRGPKLYNRVLSQQRAQAILAYLVEKGIAKGRIYLSFYGEEKPLQPCQSGNCSEFEHKMNRRAEFILNLI